MNPITPLIFTPAVKKLQKDFGSRSLIQNFEEKGGFQQKITPAIQDFIQQRDSFYLGTASLDGQPYIQHRGGAKGFLKVLDETTLAFADLAGNRQYISVGTLTENKKVSLFLMDYPHQIRVKIWATGHIIENNPLLLEKIKGSSPGKIERIILFKVKAWDINCPKYIQQRYTPEEFENKIALLQQRIADLEAKNKQLTKQITPEASNENSN